MTVLAYIFFLFFRVNGQSTHLKSQGQKIVFVQAMYTPLMLQNIWTINYINTETIVFIVK